VRALWIESGRLRLRDDVEPPAPRDGETRVRVRLAGVCATDLALLRGYLGFHGVPGHEFVGEALDGPLAGRRVVGEINAACGRCARCRAGLDRHCPHRTVLGILERPGAFAEELRLPAGNLHPVPDGLSDETAVFTEPVAAALAIEEQVDLARFPRALVRGDGRLGLLCAQALARRGVAVDLVGRHPERAAWLPAGIHPAGIHPGWIHHRGAPPEGSADERWPLVVEATGDPAALQAALASVEPRGTLVLKTTAEAPAALDLAPLVVDEITLMGSRCGRFAPALAALDEGAFRVEPMIDARFPLESGPAAFERASRAGTLKVLLDVHDS